MILVAGATGSLGGRVVRRLLERGEQVAGLVRESSDHAALAAAGMAVRIGDLGEPETLERACRGVDIIVSTASATKRNDDLPENVDERGNINLIEAARAAGVGHYVLVSTIAASPGSPVPAFRAKAAAEAALLESGLTYTIVRANAFMDVLFGMLIEAPVRTGQPVTLVGESTRRHAFIAEDDVAAFLVAATRHPAARDAVLTIGGPAAVTLTEVVHAYENAFGRTIPVRRISPGELIPGVPPEVSSLAAALETFDSPIDMDETAGTHEVTLTSVREFAASRARS